LLARAAKEGRSDDNLESIKQRLKVYHDQTAPLVAYYDQQGVVSRIPGMGNVDEIQARVARRRWREGVITIKSPREAELMGARGSHRGDVLALVRSRAVPGVSTWQLDLLAEEFIRSHDGATLRSRGCTVSRPRCAPRSTPRWLHGIRPGSGWLAEGDILSVDVGACIGGLHADGALTAMVGEVSPGARKLLETTERALAAGIAAARAAGHVGTSARRCSRWRRQRATGWCASWWGMGSAPSSTRSRRFPNYGFPHRGPRLMAGMTIAIEPMINLGRPEVRTLPDKWTVVTVDGSLSAHFEHTVLIHRERGAHPDAALAGSGRAADGGLAGARHSSGLGLA